jgi:hypothetical protein
MRVKGDMKIKGVKVEDAKRKITLAVTEEDVRLGTLKQARSCAAANAICRQTGATEARVHASRAYIKQGGKWLRFTVPLAMRSEIIAFDRGGDFAPGEYILTPVQPSVRLGVVRNHGVEKRKGNHHSKNKRKRAYHVVSGVRKRMSERQEA